MNTQDYVVIPTIGKFSVRIDTSLKKYITLSLGGTKKKCVYLTIPTEMTDTDIKLSWVESGECTMDDMTIKGTGTQQMLWLAFTIAKELGPHCTHITFHDSSHFDCEVPNGIRKTSLQHFYMAFYQKTWYEDKFGAILENEQDRKDYLQGIRNFQNPTYKPESFFFVTKEITDILQPLYERTTTWKEFFSEIAKTYRSSRCALIYPWIQNALTIIFDKKNPYTNSWEIEINEKNTPVQTYYQVQETIKGGGEFISHSFYTEQPAPSSDVYTWDMRSFVRATNKKARKTRRNRKE